jgi:hypothetical protein
VPGNIEQIVEEIFDRKVEEDLQMKFLKLDKKIKELKQDLT